MKKKLLVILICMLLIGSIMVGAGTSTNEKIISFNIRDGTINVKIPIKNYEIETTELGDEISIKDFGHLLIPGKPNLPSKIFSIAIPPGAEFVDISFELSESIILQGYYNILPASLPRVIGEENPEVYKQEQSTYEENYNSVYLSNEPYPYSAVEFVRTAGFRKYNLIDVKITPFTYYPLSGQLIYYPEIDIFVSYRFPDGYLADDVMIDNIPNMEQRAEKIIFNYDSAKTWYETRNKNLGTYDYVIITLDSLTSSVSSLVNWEESKGKDVKVVTTSWINSNYAGYDLAEKMRNFLRDKYPSNEWGIEDVCLIGHYDDVPMRRCWQDTGYGKPRTDYYYAELSLPDSESWDANGNQRYGENSDPIDFYAEVNVGRIPWSTSSTVSSICQKSVDYELNSDDSFKKNILLLGAFFWPNTDNAVLMEAKVDQYWMSDWTMTRMYEQGQSSYPMDYNLNYNNVKTVWSSGTYAFVNWAGHGSPTACYEYYPSQAFVNTATCNELNDNYPAIIFADACSNSDTDHLNIGQAMLKQGAIGFLGATQVAYGMPGWNDPSDGSSQSMDYFFTTKVTSGDYTQGEAHQWALLEMYTNNLWYYTYYEMFQWGALWGNPDLGLESSGVEPNDPPYEPSNPSPWNGQTDVDIDADLSWTGGDPDPGDYVVYDVYLEANNPIPATKVSDDQSETTFDPGTLEYSTIYYWKVHAKDNHNWVTRGPIWHFTTMEDDNRPPENPIINGPPSGKIGTEYEFTFNAVDPDGDDVKYYIDWDDGDSDTTAFNPSGIDVKVNHTWNSRGTYIIKVKAEDEFGLFGPESTFGISITNKTRAIYTPFLQFLQYNFYRFIILQKILLLHRLRLQ